MNTSEENTTSESSYHYRVLVLDNFHLGDSDEEYMVGPFPTCRAALSYARELIDSFAAASEPGQTADELFRSWVHFGETPILQTDDPVCQFSSREYARERFKEVRAEESST